MNIHLDDLLDDPLDFFLIRLWSYLTYKDIIQISMIKRDSRLKCHNLCNHKHTVPISLNNNSELINDIDFNYVDMFTNILKVFPIVKILTMRPSSVDLAYCFSESFSSHYNNPQFQKHLTCLSARYKNDVDLMGIDKLVNLTYLDISTSKGVTGHDSALYFSNMKNLKDINLSNCMNLIDDFVIAIICSESSYKLLSLRLRDCRGVSDRSLCYFHKFKQLQILNLSNCPQINDESIGYLQTLITLTDLNISNCYRITDVGLNFLSLLTNLEILDIEKVIGISDIGTNQLSSLVKLKDLNISKCKDLTDIGLQFLACLTNLEYLYMSELGRIKGEGLSNLCNSNKIKILNLERCDSLKLFELGYLTSNNVMIHLDLSNCYSLSNLSSLGFLVKLKYLNLQNCHKNVKNEFIKLSSLVNLRDLTLGNCQISSDTIMHLLMNYLCLTYLVLDGCENIDDNTLHYISLYSTRLAMLSLKGCSTITDNGLIYLKSLPKLIYLNISKCNKITSAGIISFSDKNKDSFDLLFDDCELIKERDKRLIKRMFGKEV